MLWTQLLTWVAGQDGSPGYNELKRMETREFFILLTHFSQLMEEKAERIKKQSNGIR
jgi:hypothetical protein